MVSGYLRDDKFDISPAVERIITSPKRGDALDATGEVGLPAQKPLNPMASQSSLGLDTSMTDLDVGFGGMGNGLYTSMAEGHGGPASPEV